MSDRERWIIYPLLFLALGTSLRDKLAQKVETEVLLSKRIDAEVIRCKQIMVTNQQGKPQILLSSNEAGGLVRVFDAPDKLTLALGHFGRISGLLAGAEGKLVPWVPLIERQARTGESSSETPPDEEEQ